MSTHTLPTRRPILLDLILSTAAIAWTGLAAIAFATPALSTLDATIAATSASRLHERQRSVAMRHATFEWTGVFDLVGTGFPDGERHAVMSISHQDSVYALVMLEGPPGTLKSLNVRGDSAHVVWNLGRDEMFVDLRGAGDSVSGAWSTADLSGEIHGVRRR